MTHQGDVEMLPEFWALLGHGLKAHCHLHLPRLLRDELHLLFYQGDVEMLPEFWALLGHGLNHFLEQSWEPLGMLARRHSLQEENNFCICYSVDCSAFTNRSTFHNTGHIQERFFNDHIHDVIEDLRHL